MPESAASPAVRGRRRARREEWSTQRVVLRLLRRHLPCGTFFSALENSPRSALAGMMAKQRGTRPGLPDLLFVWPGRGRRPHPVVVAVELKSRGGIASPAQRQIRDELVAAGARWWLARTPRACLLALFRSRIPLVNYTPPPGLADWEGPFPDPYERLPQHPAVRRERLAAARRYRARRREAARLAMGEAVTQPQAGCAIIPMSTFRRQ